MVVINRKIVTTIFTILFCFFITINTGLFPNMFLKFISWMGASEEVNFNVN